MGKVWKLDDSLANNIKEAITNEIRNRRDEALKETAKFYLDEVQKFYNEYPPQVYERHPASNALDSGMGKTFDLVKGEKKEKNMLYVYGALVLNTSHMYRDYRAYTHYNGHNDYVLYTFSQGIHGLPTYEKEINNPNTPGKKIRKVFPAIQGKVNPIQDTKKFVSNVLNPKLSEKIHI